MHNELFKYPAIVSRYRTGPYLEDRERFLRQASANGYSCLTLERIAWVLLTVAESVHRNNGCVTVEHLKKLSLNVRLRNGRRPSAHSASLILRFGEAAVSRAGCGPGQRDEAGAGNGTDKKDRRESR